MIRRLLALALALMGTAATATMTWPDLRARPKPAPDATIAYGADPLQHVDLWLPKGAGPFPVAVMLHGGCWQTEIAKADLMNWIAGDLRARGIAVWNVEYRGVDRPGGGYPGTFRDAKAGADALAAAARRYPLDLARTLVIGHSAGGHLALWLAARGGIPASSPLHGRVAVPPRAAISLGGLPDLQAASLPPGDTCGAAVIPRLVGTSTPKRPDVYRDTSPAVMPQPVIPVTLVNGTADRIALPAFAEAYAAKAPHVRRVTIDGEGHVELITPGTKAWTETARLIEAALK